MYPVIEIGWSMEDARLSRWSRRVFRESMGFSECLNKAHVKLRYSPPDPMHTPLNCSMVVVTRPPRIRIRGDANGDLLSIVEAAKRGEATGVRPLCAAVSSEGAGGVILLLEVGAFIEWEIGFLNRQKRFVTETHRVYFTLPVLHKLQGPMMLVMARSPWSLKLPFYGVRIAQSLHKIHEVEKLLGEAAKLLNTRCPPDIKRFVDWLQKYETDTNLMLRRAALGATDGEIAKRMDAVPANSGRFAGSRYA